MCCLFGIYNYSNNPVKNMSDITNSLALQATARGTDAAGIAYCKDNDLIIHKEPKSACNIKFKHSDSTIAVMGHTRHTTQGKEIFNFNNHPFSGHCKNVNFALAHNGILANDKELKKKFNLPKTKIETDSYVAVQLLQYKNKLNSDSLKFMAEQVEGSFSFTVLDSKNTLRFVKGDSPLSLIHFPNKKLYVYASTDSILYKALIDSNLFEDIKKGEYEEIELKSGEIANISSDGIIRFDKFEYRDTSYFNRFHWWDFCYESPSTENTYISDLKSIAKSFGYAPEAIDQLIQEGFTPEEVEEFIYCVE